MVVLALLWKLLSVATNKSVHSMLVSRQLGQQKQNKAEEQTEHYIPIEPDCLKSTRGYNNVHFAIKGDLSSLPTIS